MSDNAFPVNSHTSRGVPRVLLWSAVLAGAGFYLADTLIDAWVFEQGEVLNLLLRPSAHELWMRLSVIGIALFFSGLAYLQLMRERAATERAQTAERFFSSVVDNIPDMVFIKDAQNLRFVHLNPAAERILGFSSRELLGRDDYDFFPEIQADFFTGKDREVLRSGQVVSIPEEEISTRDHGTRVLRTKKVPIPDDAGRPAYLLGIAEDITDTWTARQALRKTETRFRTLFDFAAEFIFVIDPEGRILLTNRYAVEHSGYTEAEIVSSKIKRFFTPDSQAICDRNLPKLRATGSNRADFEFVCKDGRVLAMECNATAVPDERGEFSSFLIILRDVTERARAAAALADSERRFKAIFNSTYQLIGLLGRDGRVLEVNRTALDVGGLEPEDVVGKPFWEIVGWGLADEARERVRQAVREAALGKPVRYEEELAVSDGSRRLFDFTLKPVLDDAGETVLIIPEGRDITDSRTAEEEARRHLQEAAHVMRLGTMGQLASTIAHELNQPLTALVGYCGTAKSLAQQLQPQPEKLDAMLDRAMEQAHRAGNIIRHFREFVCKGNEQRIPVDIDGVLDGVLDLLRGELRNTGIVVKLHRTSGGCRIVADRMQIEQVILNLLRNSIEAIVQSGGGDGCIDVYTRRLPAGEVELTVVDDGPGVAPELQGQLFEPFRSDKATGMGVGLSISRSIIEAHGGSMWFNRERQGGAEFALRLPGCETGDGASEEGLSG